MRLAAVQFKPDRQDLPGSRARLAHLAAEAAASSDLVVLPEMAGAGYVFDRVEDVPLEAPDGPTFAALSPVARAHGAWIVAGFPERADDGAYNSALIIDAQGALAGVYRKTLLFEADLTWARPGRGDYPVFNAAGGRFTVGICMDLNDPRFILWCWRQRVDAVAFPTNWLEEGLDIWPYWHGRLGGSGAALVAANTWGEDRSPGQGTIRFCGRSGIFARHTELATLGPSGDGVARATFERADAGTRAPSMAGAAR